MLPNPVPSTHKHTHLMTNRRLNVVTSCGILYLQVFVLSFLLLSLQGCCYLEWHPSKMSLCSLICLIVSVEQIQHEVSLRELPSSVFCDAKPTHEKQKTVPNVCKLISTLQQNRHTMPAVSIVSLLLFTHNLNGQLKEAGRLSLMNRMLTLAANVLARQVQFFGATY